MKKMSTVNFKKRVHYRGHYYYVELRSTIGGTSNFDEMHLKIKQGFEVVFSTIYTQSIDHKYRYNNAIIEAIKEYLHRQYESEEAKNFQNMSNDIEEKKLIDTGLKDSEGRPIYEEE
jgi:hypothetical protein